MTVGRILQLPRRLLQEIVDAAGDLDWSAKPVFLDALQVRSQTALTGADAPSTGRKQIAPDDFFQADRQPWKPLRPNADHKPLDIDRLAATIEADGELARYFPGYEHREQQVEMLRAVGNAFNTGEHLMVEAPTGVGKSLAYLIPAIDWATQNNERVVIARPRLICGPLTTDRHPERGAGVNAAAVVRARQLPMPAPAATLRRRRPTWWRAARAGEDPGRNRSDKGQARSRCAGSRRTWSGRA